MDLLREAPPGFDGIARAFAMAKHLPTSHRMDLKIGLARDGVLFAQGRLDGYRQVNLFAEHLRELGWQEHLLGGDEDMQGCDMLFSLPAGQLLASQAEEDPSFIRRPAVELWPALSDHADH
jgi:hypothetical protein